jgi:glycosyltransferase involved in cell wall biosynthesis
MRIAFDARSLASPVLRGWDRYTVGLVRSLVACGVEPILLHTIREPICEKHLAEIDARTLGVKGGRGLWWEQVALPGTLRKLGVDLYHAPAERGVPFLHPCPRVLTLHSATRWSFQKLVEAGTLPGPVQRYVPDHGGSRRWWAPRYWTQQVRSADHILAPSDFARDEIIEGLRVPDHRITAVPLAVDTQFSTNRKSPRALDSAMEALGVTTPFVLYVGGYEPHKNVEGLLPLFAAIYQHEPSFHFVLVGTGDIPGRISSLATDLGIRGQCVFLHDLGRELTDLYDAAVLFASLSWRETFCLPALEAMTRGTPALASAWGATPETIGGGGQVVDPRDVASATAAALEIIRGDRESLETNARDQAGRFDWTVTARRTIAVYESVLGRG